MTVFAPRHAASYVFVVAAACGACETKIPASSVSPAASNIVVASPPTTSSPSMTAPPPPPPRPKMLAAESGIVDLKVPGYGQAVVSLPLGATGRMPVVIATHGNYDRPEWQCEVWRGIVGNRAFVLCPRGIARSDSPSPDDIRFTYENNQLLERELDAALDALTAAYVDFVDDGPLIYTGFSLGAIMGVTMAGRKPNRARRMVLIEGGHTSWKPEVVKAFAERGDGRVLFACSQPGCEQDANWAAARLRKAQVQVRIIKTKNVGHRYDGPVADSVRDAFSWVIEGDDRFRQSSPEKP